MHLIFVVDSMQVDSVGVEDAWARQSVEVKLPD